MLNLFRGSAVVIVAGTLALAAPGLGAQVPDAGVSVRITPETAPPGSIVQMKVLITEPKPITTGRGRLSFSGFDDIEGIALGSTDSAGIAIVRGGEIAISILSPTATFGMDPDYAALTVAGRVPLDAPLGSRFPMTMDPAALQFIDPGGAVYPAEIKNGHLLVGNAMTIADVTPGSADLPAGATVSIFGSGFRPDTRVRLKETALAQVLYINPGQIDVVLADPTRMHGKAIRFRNPDGSEATYFSYQRTGRTGRSAHPVLRHVVPIFPMKTFAMGSVQLAARTVGIAVQNLESTDTSVFAELLDGAGDSVATGLIEVPAHSYVVRTVSEIFGVRHSATRVVRLLSVSPVQMLGVDVDRSGAASPRLPQ